MSIFHQDIQQAAQNGSILPGTPFWNEWLNNVTGPSRLSQGVDISIRDGILHLADAGFNLVLVGGINLDRYLCGIKGINCGGYIKIKGKDGKFEMVDNQFQFYANATISIHNVDNFCNAMFNASILNIRNVGKLSNSDISNVQIIRRNEISNRFENCKFGSQNKIYYDCDYDQLDEYFRICPDACTFVKDVINDINVIRGHRAYFEDAVELKHGNLIFHRFNHAFSYSLLNLFGVTTDIDEMIINIIRDGNIIARIFCESYFDTRSVDPQSVTLDNFNILWTLN